MTSTTAFCVSGLCLIATVLVGASTPDTATAQHSSKRSIAIVQDAFAEIVLRATEVAQLIEDAAQALTEH